MEPCAAGAENRLSPPHGAVPPGPRDPPLDGGQHRRARVANGAAQEGALLRSVRTCPSGSAVARSARPAAVARSWSHSRPGSAPRARYTSRSGSASAFRRCSHTRSSAREVSSLRSRLRNTFRLAGSTASNCASALCARQRASSSVDRASRSLSTLRYGRRLPSSAHRNPYVRANADGS